MTMVFPAVPPVVEIWIVRGRSWWAERQPRERMLLAGLAVIVGLALAINGVWRPVVDARLSARQDIRIYDDLAVRLRAAEGLLKAPSVATRSGSVQVVATATAAEAALSIRQIEQQGVVTAVALDGADFKNLITWLDRLEREQGISVARAEFERQTSPGLVNARLSLVRP